MAAMLQRLGGGHIQVTPATASHLVTKSSCFRLSWDQCSPEKRTWSFTLFSILNFSRQDGVDAKNKEIPSSQSRLSYDQI